MKSGLALRVGTEHGGPLEHISPHGLPEDAAYRIDLARAFARLSETDQEALALIAWDGLTPGEAAGVLAISTSAFSVRLSRARRRLRTHLDPSDGRQP